MDLFFNLQQSQNPAGFVNPLPTGVPYSWFYPGMQQLPGVPMMLQQQDQSQHQLMQADQMKGAEQSRQPLTTLTNLQPVIPSTGSTQEVLRQGKNEKTVGDDPHLLNGLDKMNGEQKSTQRTQKRKQPGGGGGENEGEEVASLSHSYVVSQQKQAIIFCKVIGRLSVVGGQRSYNITADEIFRRTELPECMQRSHLIPLLRRGKIKNCGKDLQDLLEEKGLSANYRRDHPIHKHRKPPTTLSAFLEDEGVQLSSDHREILFTHFPLTSLARLIVHSIRSPSEMTQYLQMTKSASVVAKQMETVLHEWTNGGWDKGIHSVLASPFREFALMTHAFGVQECLLFSSFYSRYLDVLYVELSAQLSKVHTQFAAYPMSMMHNQFPPGIELPEIDKGTLHTPDIEEEAILSSHFAEIPGRLTLSNKKYNVTVAEIFRRVRAPESLNLSILGSLLKKGKTKDNGNELRDELRKFGINMEQGRRKSARITGFTSLVESEAMLLASDIQEEAIRSFPQGPLSEAILASTQTNTHQAIEERIYALTAAGQLASSLSRHINSLRLPLADRIPHSLVHHAYLMLNYSSLTHGYGPDACESWLGIFHKTFEHAAQMLPRV